MRILGCREQVLEAGETVPVSTKLGFHADSIVMILIRRRCQTYRLSERGIWMRIATLFLPSRVWHLGGMDRRHRLRPRLNGGILFVYDAAVVVRAEQRHQLGVEVGGEPGVVDRRVDPGGRLRSRAVEQYPDTGHGGSIGRARDVARTARRGGTRGGVSPRRARRLPRG